MRRLKARGVSIDLHLACARGGAAASPTASPSCATASTSSPTTTANFDREQHRPRHGRARPVEELYGRAQGRRVRPPGERVLSVQNLRMGRWCSNNSLLGLCRADHRRLRPDRLGPHGDLQGRRRHHQARLLPRRRDLRSTAGRCAIACRAPAVRDGIVYVTEDRKIEGFFETMSIAENIYSGLLGQLGRAGRCVSRREDAERSARNGPRRSTSARSARTRRSIELSGGNQQKVVIAKSLVQKPEHRSSSTSRRAASTSARSPRSTSSSTARRRGHGGGGDLVLPAGDHEPVGPHPGLPPGPDRRGILGRARRPRKRSCTRRSTDACRKGAPLLGCARHEKSRQSHLLRHRHHRSRPGHQAHPVDRRWAEAGRRRHQARVGVLPGAWRAGRALRLSGPVRATGVGFFLDLKLHDIPNTVAGGIRGRGRARAHFHHHPCQRRPRDAEGRRRRGRYPGRQAQRAAAQASGRHRAHLARPCPTSRPPASMPTRPTRCCDWRDLAHASGLDGVICSPLEIAALAQAVRPRFRADGARHPARRQRAPTTRSGP